MLPIREILPALRSPKKIFITTHHRPDGDAIGSLLGLTHYLRHLGHHVTPVAPSEMPQFLSWMPGAADVIDYEATPHPALDALKTADLIFCLDFNNAARTKGLEQPLLDATAPRVMIDHHMFPQDVFQYGISEPDKSSTCEMVYDFIRLDGGERFIDVDTAACLYTGLMTDTGAFRFPAASASAHAMAADLKSRGLEHTPIHEAVYDSWSHNRMKFLGFALTERMEIFPKLNSGLIALSKKDVYQFNLGPGDTEGLVNYPLSVSGIRFATLITERPGEVRMSFRSKGTFDVNEFARTHFNGGGHFNASGGRSLASFTDTVAQFKGILAKFHPL